MLSIFFFFISSIRRHTISKRDWSSDVCSSDLYNIDGACVVNEGDVFVGAAVQVVQAQAVDGHKLVKALTTGNTPYGEIGRASCRERVWIWGGDGSLYRMS